MLTFSGGKFLESCDKDAAGCSGESTTRSVYSIWDFGGTICKRSELAAVGVEHFPATTMPKNRHVFDYGALAYPGSAVNNASCVTSGVRTLPSVDGKSAYSLASYKLGFYVDLELPLENVVNLEVFGKTRVIFETDYRKSGTDACESEYVTYPYDNFSLTGKPLEGIINPPLTPEVEALVAQLIARGYTEAKARQLAAGIGGPGSLSLAGSYGLLRRNTFKQGNKCYLSYNGNVIGPVACGTSRIVKRTSWREIITD
jgi:hypothetical protein